MHPIYPSFRLVLEVALLVAALASQQAVSIRVGRKLQADKNQRIDVLFNKKQSVTIQSDTQAEFCFKNRVDCIKYSYSVKAVELGGNAQSIVAFVAEKKDIQAGAISSDTVCVGSICSTSKIGIPDESKAKFCVVLANKNHPDLGFTSAGPDPVEVVVEIEGCPTTSQIVVAIAVPIAVVFAIVVVCFSYFWIKRRKRVQSTKQGSESKHSSGQLQGKEPQMTENLVHKTYPQSGDLSGVVRTTTPYMISGLVTGQANSNPGQFAKV